MKIYMVSLFHRETINNGHLAVNQHLIIDYLKEFGKLGLRTLRTDQIC